MAGPMELFTKKLGPLPVWGWMGIGTAGLLAIGQGSKGKKSQAATTATPAVNTTAGPANAMGGYLSGGNGGNQCTGGKNGQYGHTGAPGFGNGWTRPAGHLSSSPAMTGVKPKVSTVTVGQYFNQPGNPKSGTTGAWNATLPGIAQHSGVPLSTVQRLNPGVSTYHLTGGQKIKV